MEIIECPRCKTNNGSEEELALEIRGHWCRQCAHYIQTGLQRVLDLSVKHKPGTSIHTRPYCDCIYHKGADTSKEL